MKLTKLNKHPNSHGYGIGKNVLGTLELAGASFGFGYLQSRYPGKAKVGPVPLDLAVGIASKVVSLGLTLGGVGGAFRPHLDSVGNAGLACYAHTLGAGMGFKKSGQVRAVLPASAAGKLQQAVPQATILGIDQRAPKGDLLVARDLANIARGR